MFLLNLKKMVEEALSHVPVKVKMEILAVMVQWFLKRASLLQSREKKEVVPVPLFLIHQRLMLDVFRILVCFFFLNCRGL